MSDLEEGEIEGPPPPPPPQQFEQIQQQRPPALSPHDEDKVLAPRPSGRAPYYSGPDTNGFKGRGGGGGGKKKRKKAAAAAAAAAGFVDVYGKGASAAIELYHEQGPIRLPDVQNLLLWVLGQGANPRWCFVKNKPLVKKVLLLVAHGLDAASWEAAAASGALPAWRAHLGQPIELQARNATLAPGSTVHSLLTVPQTKKRRREDDPQHQAPAGAAGEAYNAAGPAAGVSNGALPAAEAAGAAAPVGPGAAAAARNGSGTGNLQEAAAEAATKASADQAAAPDEATDSAAAAKRMKVSAADDVSSRVQPQLAATTGQTPAQQPGAGQLAQELDGQQPQQQTQQAQQQAQQEQQAPRHTGRGGSHPLPPAHYVLSLDELQEHGYPLPRFDEAQGEMVCPEGFVATRATKGAAAPHDLVALDCEMCITDAGFELTRATLLDGKGQVLLDELCVPANPITDHNTRFSGITAEMLEGVATRLGDVQARFRELVAAETLVVAHSGENDLQALKIIHANVIDTAVLFPHPRGPPFKSALRVLASRHLLRTIQTGEHDPVEDARAALDLALLKFERGPGYGAASTERGEKLVEVLGSAGRRSTMVDRLELLNRQVAGNCAAVVADDDAAVVAALARELPKAQVHFLWGQLTALHRCYEARLAATKASGAAEPSQAYLLPRPDGGQQQQPEQQQQQQQQDKPQQEDGAEPEAGQPPAGQGQAVVGAAQGSAQQQPASQEQQRQQQGAGHGQHAQPHEQALAELDAGFAALWAAAPAGTLVVVVTGQGDTAYCRYLQEQKWRRQQQQQQQDGQPPWSPACEAHLAAWQSRVQSALCFAAVKGAAPQQDEQLAGQQQQQNGQAQQGGEQSAGETPQG
ncbi:hypothetical protein D9Q98_004819 [Chlorella vulgaris]|uniref:Exonuclease domain-containing protein n=1 Tax=Chlorella vulgaris TaxID=3077 RepID=A0A9D4TN06_CHLVU|nr:hypothetical protein D9Q98_004819 [Chlorella vulgaris]